MGEGSDEWRALLRLRHFGTCARLRRSCVPETTVTWAIRMPAEAKGRDSDSIPGVLRVRNASREPSSPCPSSTWQMASALQPPSVGTRAHVRHARSNRHKSWFCEWQPARSIDGDCQTCNSDVTDCRARRRRQRTRSGISPASKIPKPRSDPRSEGRVPGSVGGNKGMPFRFSKQSLCADPWHVLRQQRSSTQPHNCYPATLRCGAGPARGHTGRQRLPAAVEACNSPTELVLLPVPKRVVSCALPWLSRQPSVGAMQC